MCKMPSLILAGMLIGIFPFLAAAEGQTPSAPAYVEKATGLTFPGAIGLLAFGGAEEYEDESLGVAIEYSAEGVTATVYVYNAGQAVIPTGAESPIHKEVVAAALSDIQEVSRQGYYQDLAIGPEAVVDLAGRGRGHRARHVSLAYSFQGARWHSHLLVFGHENRLIKVRFSYLNDFKAAGEEQLKALRAWLDGALGGPGR